MEKQLTGKQQLETEIRTVDTLLDRGIRIQLPAPRLLRWLGKPTVGLTVKRPSSATLFDISALYLKMKGNTDRIDPSTLDESHQLIYDCMVPASRIIAYAIRPSFTPLRLGNRWLARYLRQHLNTRQLTELWVMVCSLSGAHDFSNIIRSMSGMRITMPRTTD